MAHLNYHGLKTTTNVEENDKERLCLWVRRAERARDRERENWRGGKTVFLCVGDTINKFILKSQTNGFSSHRTIYIEMS